MSPALTKAQQKIVVQIGRNLQNQSGILRLLASRDDITPAVRTKLLDYPGRIREVSLFRTTDGRWLKGASDGDELAAIALNPRTDPKLLRKLVNHSLPGVAVNALRNAATPKAARERILAHPELTQSLLKSRRLVGHKPTYASEIAIANPDLVRRADEQLSAMRRGLRTLPNCPASVLPRGALHPSLRKVDLSQMSSTDLSKQPSAAAHIVMLERADCKVEDAARVLEGFRSDRAKASTPLKCPEPHVVGRIYRRFGSAVNEALGTPVKLGFNESIATALVDPFAAEMYIRFEMDSLRRSGASRVSELMKAASAALTELGENDAAWAVFARIASEESQTVEGIVESAEVAARMV